MLFDIKDILIKEFYIPQIQCLRDTYINNVQCFFADIDNRCKPYIAILDDKSNKHQNDKLYCVCDEPEYQVVSNYEDLKYHYLSSALQSIVALWENQLSDLYLSKDCADYNSIKERLKEYYNLDADSGIDEIRQVYNYLKHGPHGKGEENLIKMNSHYFRNDGYDGEIRGNYYRNKQLNIAECDIPYFADTLIGFWEKVYAKIEELDRERLKKP